MGLEGNSFEGAIPTEFGQLTSLGESRPLLILGIAYRITNSPLTHVPEEYLTLESNQLDGSIPSELGRLENLEKLAVHKNHFNGTIPSQICSATNTGNLVVSADCAEVECKCCAICCVGCKQDDSGILINKFASELVPANDNSQEQVDVAGVTDFPSHVPSEAPTHFPTSAPSPAPPSPAPSKECSVRINVRGSCFQTDKGDIEVEFHSCQPNESDWIGLFKDDKGLDEVSTSAPPTDKAEHWLRSCGNQKCHEPTNSGTVSFGKEDLHRMKQGDYRILLVQDDVTTAMSQMFEVRKKC